VMLSPRLLDIVRVTGKQHTRKNGSSQVANPARLLDAVAVTDHPRRRIDPDTYRTLLLACALVMLGLLWLITGKGPLGASGREIRAPA
jgi:hypothetical protein